MRAITEKLMFLATTMVFSLPALSEVNLDQAINEYNEVKLHMEESSSKAVKNNLRAHLVFVGSYINLHKNLSSCEELHRLIPELVTGTYKFSGKKNSSRIALRRCDTVNGVLQADDLVGYMKMPKTKKSFLAKRKTVTTTCGTGKVGSLGKVTSCVLPGLLGLPDKVSPKSKNKCKLNSTYGYHATGVWVKNLCQVNVEYTVHPEAKRVTAKCEGKTTSRHSFAKGIVVTKTPKICQFQNVVGPIKLVSKSKLCDYNGYAISDNSVSAHSKCTLNVEFYQTKSSNGRSIASFDTSKRTTMAKNSQEKESKDNEVGSQIIGKLSQPVTGQDGTTTIRGWACMTGSKSPVRYQVFAGRPDWKKAVLIGEGVADNRSGKWVREACQAKGNHRFKISVPDWKTEGIENRRVFVRILPPKGSGLKRVLSTDSGTYRLK